MRDCPTLHKFPVGSTNRDYDIFETLADGRSSTARERRVRVDYSEQQKQMENLG
jgi:hypothetical protein